MSACKHCGGRFELVGDILNPQGMRCQDCGQWSAESGPVVIGVDLSTKEDATAIHIHDPDGGFIAPSRSIGEIEELIRQQEWVIVRGPSRTVRHVLPPSPVDAGEEGGPCPDCGVSPLELRPRDRDGCCTCFVSAPCSHCMSTVPECLSCGWRAEEP
jgi:hypothetical protein